LFGIDAYVYAVDDVIFVYATNADAVADSYFHVGGNDFLIL
jgi:hypothetical protein